MSRNSTFRAKAIRQELVANEGPSLETSSFCFLKYACYFSRYTFKESEVNKLIFNSEFGQINFLNFAIPGHMHAHVQYCRPHRYKIVKSVIIKTFLTQCSPIDTARTIRYLMRVQSQPTLPHECTITFDDSFDLSNLAARYELNNSSVRHQTTVPQIKYYIKD